MIIELLGLAGIGAYLYSKYGRKNHRFIRDYHTKGRNTMVRRKERKEIDRVLFGKYIVNPYNTEYFEFNCTVDKVPASNEIRRAIYAASRCNPPAQLRASCSVCDCGDGSYQHRWMVCCATIDDMVFKDELIYAIYGEYLKGSILTK